MCVKGVNIIMSLVNVEDMRTLILIPGLLSDLLLTTNAGLIKLLYFHPSLQLAVM
jgi:hypothetical protein